MASALVIGGGGREHAICWKLSQSPSVSKIYAAPGSFGISQLPKCEIVKLDLNDFVSLSQWAKGKGVNVVIVGPEDPLSKGLGDALAKAGVLCFGPTSLAARIESDKGWAKDFMHRHHIPTARYKVFDSRDPAKEFINNVEYNALVVKASGLAAGKGVVVASNRAEACEAVDMIFTKFPLAAQTVVVEELLQGEEISVLCFTDGKTVCEMLPAQDHKRVFDDDKGPNTGGMGAYCPCPLITKEQVEWVKTNVLQKTIDGMAQEGLPFIGVLYAGLMMTEDGPRVLEFNCRFGDPETQVILPLLENDLFDVIMASCKGSLSSVGRLNWKNGKTAVGVIMSSKGYPESSSKGDVISGLDRVPGMGDMLVFHSGVGLDKEDRMVTNGGRVLIAVSLCPSLMQAAAKATKACRSLISFPGAHFRTDISHKAIPRWMLSSSAGLTYRASGVDINAGANLVDRIKDKAQATSSPATLSSLGGFGALYSPKLAGYKDPILVSGTDGVGTKLKVAFDVGKHTTVGQDLVAMCVNDILCHGAEPLFFLDYFATGKLNVDQASDVIGGISSACAISGAALVGGETAEMPGLYQEGEYDLAGFAVGAVESGHQLPLTVKEGDLIFALPSSGVHSNGFSLVRKVVASTGMSFTDKAPFSNLTIGEELLKPTKIYVKDLLPLIHEGKIRALAHITGGGLTENIPRVLPSDVKASIDATKWNIPPIFPWLSANGKISETEMLKTFNCGIGMVIIAESSQKDVILSKVSGCVHIGEILSKTGGESAVDIHNFSNAMELLMKPYVALVVSRSASRKRIGVLISGTGSNLQALINAVQAGNIDGDIVLVISNKPGVEGLKKAALANITSMVIKHQDYPNRKEFELACDMRLREAGVEIVVLAGFMRVLSDVFVSRWRGKLVNLHPSLLPLFKGLNAAQQALDSGVRVTGCTVHFVEVDVDAGAIIVQETVEVLPSDTVDTLQARIHKAEHRALPRAVQLICQDKITLDLTAGKLIWN